MFILQLALGLVTLLIIYFIYSVSKWIDTLPGSMDADLSSLYDSSTAPSSAAGGVFTIPENRANEDWNVSMVGGGGGVGSTGTHTIKNPHTLHLFATSKEHVYYSPENDVTYVTWYYRDFCYMVQPLPGDIFICEL